MEILDKVIENLSDNVRETTNGGVKGFSDTSGDSGKECKEICDPTLDCFIYKQAERRNKLDNSSQKIVLESHL